MKECAVSTNKAQAEPRGYKMISITYLPASPCRIPITVRVLRKGPMHECSSNSGCRLLRAGRDKVFPFLQTLREKEPLFTYLRNFAINLTA